MSDEFMAFDLGLRKTGVAWFGGSTVIASPNRLSLSPMTEQTRQKRAAWWLWSFNKVLSEHRDVTQLYVEAPFMSHKHPSGALGLIELHGVLLTLCINKGIERITYPNKTLKKKATGNGNANKTQMIARANELGNPTSDDNEADAFLLWHIINEGI